MSKIRINELARELEVKPHKILDLLPELGVLDKKTHSSSIDEEIAIKVRRHFGFEEAAAAGSPRDGGPIAAVEEAPQPVEGPAEPSKAVAEPAVNPAPAEIAQGVPPAPVPIPPPAVAPPPPSPAVTATAETPVKPVVEPPQVPETRFVPRPAAPLRPPLAGPLASTLAQPKEPPAATASSPAPTPAPPQRTIAIPAKPVPPPRPGQILSGPRQPLPPVEPARVVTPAPAAPAEAPGSGAARPKTPAPAPSTPVPGRPITPPPRPAQPQASATPARPPVLAGQPVARPVVPPRPDLVARLQQQTQQKPTPGQPIARPPMPGKPPAPTPIPGQPIYRGPIRPGQPILRPSSQPGQSPTSRSGSTAQRARPTHPTAPVRIDPSVVPPPAPDSGRRDAKRPSRERHRQVEPEEKDLRLVRRPETEQVLAVNREITISEGMTVKEFSEKLGIKANLVIKKLVDRKIFATINQTLDVKLAEELAKEFGATTTQMSFEEETVFDLEMAEESSDMLPRPPVVTIMGHVDHGKTSLLDAIRESNVVEGEFGGITQHIGAYWVEKNDRKIVFIDTPGHEAFTRMRARGAKVTDIVVLVVAADDGVMPQTREAIDHARAAKVPIIVAINKIDKPEAQPERIKQQLSDIGLMPEEWGGDTIMVPLSAKTKQNIDLLLEMILLVADMQGLKANPNRPAVGTVLEAKLDRGRGPVATVLVRKGTLRVGDYFVCGAVFSRVRAMFDDRGNSLKEAGPSMPVEVLGLEDVPEVGETFQVVTDTAKAKQIVLYREAKQREEQLKKGSRVSLEALAKSLKEGEVKELNIILKADVGGTCEVLADTLQKLSTDKVKVRVLHTGVGAITETDVLLASASDGIIVGFNVRPEKSAAALAEKESVDIRLHTIIYELTDEMKKAMAGLLEPVIKETFKGRAEVRQVFRISKVGTVAGCYVNEGVITRDCQVRLLRDNIVVHTGRIGSLRRFKEDAAEVKAGYECGIAIANFNDIKPGDVIEAFVTEKQTAVI
ncbi:MAG: translation initiation factor IF-2 [Bryobacteraceae bacterium]|nr:translation initiation factor IF-2 [Bryobacteraceae bacterium]MDW8378762.1 translation initiation factor IF-2 [Bryobacterales bacterium]